MQLNEQGEYCFRAAYGLWRIWINLSPDEIDRKVLMGPHLQNDIKALVRNSGLEGLTFQQLNLQVSGKVFCTRKEFCVDLPVTLREVGTSEKRSSYKTKISKDGTYVFNLVKEGKWDVSIESDTNCFKNISERVQIGSKQSA